MSSVRRILYPGRQYLLRDEFNDDRAAGALNGVTMPAVPGPGKRTGVDTESKLSISGGKLVCSGGKAIPAWADPGLWESAVTRVAGRVLLVKITGTTLAGTELVLGWGINQTGIITEVGFYLNDGIILIDTTPLAVGATLAVSTAYQLMAVLCAAGGYYFIKGGTFTSWTRLWHKTLLTTAILYPGITNKNAAWVVDYFRVLPCFWLPPILAHDTFTRADT